MKKKRNKTYWNVTSLNGKAVLLIRKELQLKTESQSNYKPESMQKKLNYSAVNDYLVA